MNCYSEGYDAGYADGKAGKSKDYQNKMPKLKALASQNCVNTFIEGYDDGFRKGCEDRNRA